MNRSPRPAAIARAALVAMAALVAGACHKPAPAEQPRPHAPTTAAAASGQPTGPVVVAAFVGDTAAFPARITGLGYGPDRASYELTKPAYVALIAVTARSIVSLVPATGVEARIESAGPHTAGLNNTARGDRVADRFGRRAGVPEQDISAAQMQEYNRCLARARETDRKQAEGQRRVIGRDSAGRPIYGPPEYRADTRSAESYCVAPQAAGTSAAAGAMSPLGRVPPQPGRMLILYVSDAPVAQKDVLELSITETDPRLVAISIGRKLFSPRGAQWSAHVVPW